MTNPDKTVAEFFAGIGLMRMGLEKAGWSTVWANDIDETKWRMLRDHFGESTSFVLGDIHELDSSQIPSITLATASFPCNDLSLAGGRRGLAGAHSSAFWGLVNHLKAMRIDRRQPALVLLENVPGFLTSHGGTDLEKALRALNELGYFADAFILDAALFVPQSRRRLFVVAIKTELEQSSTRAVENPTEFTDSPLRPPALAGFIREHPGIAWRIRDLPIPEKTSKPLSCLIEDLPENDPIWWKPKRRDYLLNQMSPKHRDQLEAMIQSPFVSHGTIFRRVRAGKSMAELRTDGVAGCLRTPRGGSGRQILCVAGQGRCGVRLLSARECARLMGADDFTLNVRLNKALFGFGDAVCVPVIEWIGKNYLTPVWTENFGTPDAKQPVPPAKTARSSRAKQALLFPDLG